MKAVAWSIFLFLWLGTNFSAVAWAEDSQADAHPLGLRECLQLAFESHPSLAAARARVRAAQEYERAAYKNYFPKLTLSYRYTRFRDQRKVVIFSYDVPLSSYEMVQGDLVLSFPIFHGLALRAEHRLRELDVAISEVQEERTRQELAYRVKEAYWGLLKAQRKEEEARKSVERLQAHLKVARGFFEEGLIAKNDLLQSEVALAEGEHALVVARNAVTLARARLNILLGRPVTAQTKIKDSLENLPRILGFEEYLAKALEIRPEIRAARLALQKAFQGIRLAKSSLYPWIDLEGVYHKEATDLALSQNPYGDRENAWVALTLNWRIFEWGKRFHEVSGARAQALAQEAALREIRDQVKLEVREAYLRFQEARKRLEVARKSLSQAEENFALNEARYQEQLATSTDVLDAETLLTSARVNYVNALADLHLAEAYLEYAVGVEKIGIFR